MRLAFPEYVVDCAHVLSGDTIVAEGQAGTRKTIRVYGIDAPEHNQSYGPSATELARSVAEGRRVEVDVTGEDRSGHLVARVRAGRERLGPLLVRNGFAWTDRRRGSEVDSLLALQREARASGRGLWAQPNPIPPWVHRSRSSGPVAATRQWVERALSPTRGRAESDGSVARAD